MSEISYTIDPSKEEEFKRLQIEGKDLAAKGRLKESLEKFEHAKNICPTEKVLRRIEKLKSCLKSDAVLRKQKQEGIPETSAKHPSPREHSLYGSKETSVQKFNDRHSSTVLHDIQNLKKSGISRDKVADLSLQEQNKFQELKKLGKKLCYDGKYEAAIDCFRKALDIWNCPSVKRYIEEVQSLISNDVTKCEARREDISSTSSGNETDYSTVSNLKSAGQSLISNDVTKFEARREDISSTSSGNEIDYPTVSNLKSADQPKTEDLKENTPSKTLSIEEKMAEVKSLYCEARDTAAKGQLVEALELLEKAQSIHETQKVQKQINRLQELLKTEHSDSESDEMIKIADDFSVHKEIYNNLYPYQREGVAWMWKIYKMRKGGVLGDDMGLGKTFQVIAFLSGMIDAGLVNHVLIIMPVSLLPNWQRELKKWSPGIVVRDFHGSSKKERERNLLRVQRKGDVLLTSYGMVVGNVDSLVTLDDREFVWDYVILDEGHKIKNPTKTTKAVHDIPAKNRLVLTGTPIQNNLRELWSLYDFVHKGTLLGSLKTFKLQYENPITRAREKDATAGEKRLGTEMAENLKHLIKLFFLRRTKDEIWGDKRENADVDELESKMENLAISKLKARKNDLILWTFMSDSQVEIYNSFLHSAAVKAILVSKRSPLVELTILKKICDHPRLLSKRACFELGLNGEIHDEEMLREMEEESSTASSIDNVSDETLIHESGKLKLVINLLEKLKETGHRTLVFSLSRKILDMIHRILVNRKWKVLRLDGTIAKMDERERRIQKFQNDPSYYVFLLTTQVGGVGITLTAADRVIIYDPSWNPATDAQAVDRVYRIGQNKNVVIYRLITCGSVEEKIYRRQIFKDSITRQATGSSSDPFRYFSKQELRELFSLENPHYSATQVQLNEMHSSERQTDHELERHIAFLKTLNIFGISDHDLMFSGNLQDHTEDNDQGAVSHDFIKKQVASAQQLITAEATVVAEELRMTGTFYRPYQEAIKPSKKQTKDLYKPPTFPEVIDLTENAQFPSDEKPPVYTADSTAMIIESLHSPVLEKETKEKETKETKYSSKLSINDKSPNFSVVKMESDKRKSHPDSILRYSLEKKEASIIIDDEEEPQPLDANWKSVSPVKGFDSKEVLRCDKHSEELDIPHDSDELIILEDKNLSLEDKPLLGADRNSITSLHHSQNCGKSGPLEGLDFVPSPKQKTSLDMKAIKLTSEFQEKFQNDLTHLMSEDLKDLSFDDEVSAEPLKTGRKSCARKSAFAILDSDDSQQGSCPPSLNNSANLVEDSVDTSDVDSSNSASLSFVPDSVPSTPQAVKHKSPVNESFFTAQTSFSDPGTIPPNSLSNSLLRRQNIGNVERITPLKVDGSFTQENPSFAQALAASPIITPQTSPQQNINPSVLQPPNTTFTGSNETSNSSGDDDSPIKMIRRRKQAVYSESEEDDHSNDCMNSTLNNAATERNRRKRMQAISSESDESDDEDGHSHVQINSTQNENSYTEAEDVETESEHSSTVNDKKDEESLPVYSSEEDVTSLSEQSSDEESEDSRESESNDSESLM